MDPTTNNNDNNNNLIDNNNLKSNSQSDSNSIEYEKINKKPFKFRPKKWIKDFIKLCWANKFFCLFVISFTILFVICGILVWDFSWAAWYSLIIVFITFCLLIENVADPGVVMMGNTTLLLAAAIITTREALAGFSNTGVFTIAVLFIVAAGVSESGVLEYLIRYVLRKPGSLLSALLRLMIPVTFISAFINNTPLVAMMMPVVEIWSKQTGISPSKLLIPLSYAAILGGVCTIIGTSTNLIVVGLAQVRDPTLEFGFFDIAIVGVPIAIAGNIYVYIFAHFTLPERKSAAVDYLTNPKQYTISIAVENDSPVAGLTIEDAGLRHLDGLFLVEIQRGGTTLPAAASDTTLMPGDFLLFAGDVNKVKDLWRIQGLKPTNQEDKLVMAMPNRILVEAVISQRSSLIGQTVRGSGFREKFNAAIVSIYREGEPLQQRIGDIKLQAGDTLLLVSKPNFVEKHKNSNDFLVAYEIGGSHLAYDGWRQICACLLAILMIILNAADLCDLLTLALCAAFGMVFIGCFDFDKAVGHINFFVMLTISASFGMSAALENTGVAKELADNILAIFEPLGNIGILYAVYLATAVLTALLSNASSAAIMVPIVFNLGVADVKIYLYCVMVAASADFSTPIGYQTNLMVWGPGGYKFYDYTRFGFPLQVLLSIVSVVILNFAY
eukprot:TRINITY_DN254_c0_g2_i1.p1 TRINITY_DN254_c0_g2~~TRINITY_DN254_c0_g2_i1.p1  ORF type:complete len:669 (-),score=352.75 TRINITY_DN254_c0_g2_i1:136-2142(-)